MSVIVERPSTARKRPREGAHALGECQGCGTCRLWGSPQRILCGNGANRSGLCGRLVRPGHTCCAPAAGLSTTAGWPSRVATLGSRSVGPMYGRGLHCSGRPGSAALGSSARASNNCRDGGGDPSVAGSRPVAVLANSPCPAVGRDHAVRPVSSCGRAARGSTAHVPHLSVTWQLQTGAGDPAGSKVRAPVVRRCAVGSPLRLFAILRRRTPRSPAASGSATSRRTAWETGFLLGDRHGLAGRLSWVRAVRCRPCSPLAQSGSSLEDRVGGWGLSWRDADLSVLGTLTGLPLFPADCRSIGHAGGTGWLSAVIYSSPHSGTHIMR
ncbi:hypothetical protein M2158_004781 [Streptomyces sp. SAI-144]|nr:hypothetical protein [Streptomyces sp. SAI-144]